MSKANSLGPDWITFYERIGCIIVVHIMKAFYVKPPQVPMKIRMLDLRNDFNRLCKYLRPVSGCTRGEWACDTAAAAAAAAAAEDGDGCLGLLTLVLLLANSSLMVWGKSGSKRTPCCNLTNFSNMWKQLYFFLNQEIYIYSFYLIFQNMYKFFKFEFWQNLMNSLV